MSSTPPMPGTPWGPTPIDTSEVTLDPSLNHLIERLARNTYEVRLALRRAGVGGLMCSEPGTPPGGADPPPVRYRDLPDHERHECRHVVEEAIKAMRALGYQIESLGGPADGLLAAVMDIVDSDNMTLAQFLSVWERWDRNRRYGGPEIYGRLADRALKLGEYLLARDVVGAGLKFFPMDVRLRQLHALAMARSGAVQEAIRELDRLMEDEEPDVETQGLLAGAHKALWEQAPPGDERDRMLERALSLYQAAYRSKPGSYWVGINAATLARCRGEWETAQALAENVAGSCEAEIRRLRAARGQTAGDDHDVNWFREDYWLLATRAEAALVLDLREEAGAYYATAVNAAPGDVGSISSSRRNARQLLQLAGKEHLLDQWLPLPRVVMFAGHMFDAPGRPHERFPPQEKYIKAVGRAIRSRIRELRAGISYSMAAPGSDLLLLEAMLEERGPYAEVNVVLPYDRDQYVEDTVRRYGTEWERRVKKALAHRQVRISQASAGRVSMGGVAYDYTNQVIHGIASLRAGQLGTGLAALAVWDGRKGDGYGGTATIVDHWQRAGAEIHLIHPTNPPAWGGPPSAPAAPPGGVGAAPPIPSAAAPSAAAAASATPGPVAEYASVMRGLLFADVAGFSRLHDGELPLFDRHFMAEVARLADRTTGKPLLKNSWGDGLYMAFETVEGAALFALDLRDMVERTPWQILGFREKLKIRTALHYGPVYERTNPLTGAPRDYLGTHISRAARLEPVTPENLVYASQGFAAVACIQNARGFTCEYVGEVVMPKKYGKFPTYLVRRREESPGPAAPTCPATEAEQTPDLVPA